MYRMPFGKWRGHLVSTIPTPYLQWVLREVRDLNPLLKRATLETLASRGEEPEPEPS